MASSCLWCGPVVCSGFFISPWVLLVGPVGGDDALSLLLYLSFKCYIVEIYMDLVSL